MGSDLMIPLMSANATYKLNIPDMSGGVNYRDGLSLINDNQMTDCLNVWYKDGVLKTRPRIIHNLDTNKVTKHNSNIAYPNEITKNYSNTIIINGKQYVLEVLAECPTETGTEWRIKADYVSADDERVKVADIYRSGGLFEDVSWVVAKHNDEIFFFISWKSENDESGFPLKSLIVKAYKNADGEYVTTENVEAYVPLLITNGLPQDVSPSGSGGVMVEGPNLLSRYYRAEYDSWQRPTNKNETDVEMHYVLPVTINNGNLEGDDIVVNITYINGLTATHTAKIYRTPEGRLEAKETKNPSGYNDGRRITVIDDTITFWDVDSSGQQTGVAVATETESLQNNIEVIAPYYDGFEYDENVNKVASMTKSLWYGNTSLGLNGGSRLFLSGSKQNENKSLVIWSDFEKPLYFSENNCAYVGDKNQRVTALGRQGSSLIIFKEREIYSTQYTQGSVTAEQLENQSVIDLTTNLANFPMTMIHSQIGCNCPDSIQLCRNRLVWADTNGKIYTMTAQSQYSERNVYEISGMVERKLKTENLNKAVAIDWEDKYLLFVPDSANVYVMDYNSYGFVNVSSYAKKEDANIFIPFFVWNLPFKDSSILFVANVDNQAVISYESKKQQVGTDNLISMINTAKLTETREKDMVLEANYIPDIDEFEFYESEKPVKNIIKSKLFDFGAPDVQKNIYAINLVLGFNDGAPIKVHVVSDLHTNDKITLKTGKTKADERTPYFFETKCIMPFLRLCTRVGINIECDGMLALDAISLKYNLAGGKK